MTEGKSNEKESVMCTVAIIGGGVIGGGWAARFLLHGWSVSVFDPDKLAQCKLMDMVRNARTAFPQLFDGKLPQEGGLHFHDSIEDAVAGARWVQESVPERIEVKQAVIAEIESHVKADTLIGSSTSGFTPRELKLNARYPERLFVAHPFNPVYLLPLVELVVGDGENDDTAVRAKECLTSIGMHPLHIKREMPAHIADRFLEAVWREALWMIKEGSATTSEIDDAIRYGFGLRWAQMGLFETYRIAGGEAGMSHFIEQFGPCLKLPWTKLMDVPELTEELVSTIAAQSDAQSGQHTIAELERIRDKNLVGILRVLKSTNWGAGVLLNEHDKRLREAQEAKALT